MRPVRYGIIGCGDMGQVHVMNYIKRPGMVETVAVCDINDDNIQKILKLIPDSSRVRVVKDYRSLLDMYDIEAVVISTPNNTHCEIVLDAFAAGKHVFCEKPMDVTVERCTKMINAWHRSNRIFQIGLVYRYSPLFRLMAKIIQQGDIGRPLMAWCHEFREPFPIGRTREWRYSKSKSGDSLVEKDCHHFDLFNWMLGVKPTRVQAMGGIIAIKNDGSGEFEPGVSGEPYPPSLVPHPEILDHALVNIEYENGAKANLGLCLFAPGSGLPFGVLGTKGRLFTKISDHRVEIVQYDRKTAVHNRRVIKAETAIYGFADIGHSGGFAQHVEFCTSILENKPAFCDGLTGLESLYPAFAAQKSIAEEGRVVTIEEIAAS